jgi:DNA-binding Xre family transcriptional regulator
VYVLVAVAESENGKLELRLKELRGSRTLTEMARLTGIRQDELSKIERGETKGVRFETLVKLCLAYKADVSDLIAFVPAPNRSKVDIVYPQVEVKVDLDSNSHQAKQTTRKRYGDPEKMVDVLVKGLPDDVLADFQVTARQRKVPYNDLLVSCLKRNAPEPEYEEISEERWEEFFEAIKDLGNPEVMAGAWR